jgi:hypothetical protein
MKHATAMKRTAISGAILATMLMAQNALAADPVQYSGRATVIDTTVKVLTANAHVVVADTGALDPWGTTRDATVATVDNPPPVELHSRTMEAVTSGSNGTSASSAEVEKLLLGLPGLKITADVIEAHSAAKCSQETQTVATSGGSTIVNLKINGTPVAYMPKPNQKYTIPGVATITLNEQYRPDVNTIVVNAIHVVVPGAPGIASANVIVSHAESGINSCPCNLP